MGYHLNILSLSAGQDQHLKTMDAETKRDRERGKKRQREMEGKRETETERMSSGKKGGKIKREMMEEERERVRTNKNSITYLKIRS